MEALGFSLALLPVRRLSTIVLALGFAVGPLDMLGAPCGELRAEISEAAKAEVFDQASRLVRDNFYDRDLKGQDWEKVSDRHRQSYLAANTPNERSAAINAMLAELNSSHMGHFTADDPAYYQLVDIFSHGLRNDIPRHFPVGTISYPSIGVFTREISGKTFVTGVLAGLPAAKGGVVVGDEILAVDGASFQPIWSFREKIGMNVAMNIRRTSDGPVTVVSVRPEMFEPGDAFQTAMRDSIRMIEMNGKRLGYIHIWSYAGQDYQDILVKELSTGKLKDADALICDLRDGWGGAHPRYLDLFNARTADMTLIERNGESVIVNFKWRKPVTLIINEGTRSGKEVLTYGFKKYGYGPVIGSRTAGALLAGRGFLLSDGSFLMVAVNDVTVDGERIEGKGVQPTIEVPFEIPYAAGRDPQLDKAIELMSAASRG